MLEAELARIEPAFLVPCLHSCSYLASRNVSFPAKEKENACFVL